MSLAGCLEPGSSLRCSAFEVKLIKVTELEGLAHVLLVSVILLFLIRRSDLLVLIRGQASRDVRLSGCDGSHLELQTEIAKENKQGVGV